jgi:hypothetical protein
MFKLLFLISEIITNFYLKYLVPFLKSFAPSNKNGGTVQVKKEPGKLVSG